MVNFLHALITNINWKRLGSRQEEEFTEKGVEEGEEKPDIMFGGFIYKLHGNMDHMARKVSYFGFDK